jgi:hypothetical protein
MSFCDYGLYGLKLGRSASAGACKAALFFIRSLKCDFHTLGLDLQLYSRFLRTRVPSICIKSAWPHIPRSTHA